MEEEEKDLEEKIIEGIDEKQAKEELEKGYSKAEKLLENVDKTEEFLQRIEVRLKTIPRLGERLAMVPTMISLVRSYINKEYNEVPVGTILAIVSALIYFLSPADLIPDPIPFLGHLDDIKVFDICLGMAKPDLDEYQAWREKNHKIKKFNQ